MNWLKRKKPEEPIVAADECQLEQALANLREASDIYGAAERVIEEYVLEYKRKMRKGGM